MKDLLDPKTWEPVHQTMQKMIGVFDQMIALRHEQIVIILESRCCCPVIYCDKSIEDLNGFARGSVTEITLKTDCGDFKIKLKSRDIIGTDSAVRLNRILEVYEAAIRA